MWHYNRLYTDRPPSSLGGREIEGLRPITSHDAEYHIYHIYLSSNGVSPWASPGGIDTVNVKHLRKYFNQSKPGAEKDIIEFVNDILDIVESYPATQWPLHLAELLADWEATAEICLDETEVSELIKAQESIQRGEAIEWVPPADM